MPRIAIHGFGRIGRSLMRVALKDNLFVPVSISDIKDVPTLAASAYGTSGEEARRCVPRELREVRVRRQRHDQGGRSV